MNGMIQLAYFSSVSSAWTPLDSGMILQASRKNNAAREITGLLFYDKGQYLQVIEGAASSVRQLYDVIQRDERHVGVTEVFRHPIACRDFGGWSMAYQELSSIEPDLLSYADFLRTHFDIGAMTQSETKSFLQLFRRDAYCSRPTQALHPSTR